MHLDSIVMFFLMFFLKSGSESKCNKMMLCSNQRTNGHYERVKTNLSGLNCKQGKIWGGMTSWISERLGTISHKHVQEK